MAAISRTIIRCSDTCSRLVAQRPGLSRRLFQGAAPKTPNEKQLPTSRGLKKIILDKIRLSGPITVADYMKISANAYYSTAAASTDDSTFGIGGDFVTSPEISQMFGELVAVWCYYETWKMGHRGDWQLVELGPGNGSLAHDFLKTLRQLKMIRDGDADHKLSVHLVELSEALAQRQERLLCSEVPSSASAQRYSPSFQEDKDNSTMEAGVNTSTHFKRNISRFGSPVFWYKDLSDVPRRFSVAIAHEFFDALPVHKFQRTPEGKWREVYVDVDPKTSQLRFVLAPVESFAQRTYLTKEFLDRLPADASHVEISAESLFIFRQLIDRVTEDGGVVLIIDYGYDHKKGGDTLRAFRKHQLIDDFLAEDPGTFDITADVNFDYLKHYARDKVCSFGPISQGEFLKNLGIELRLKRLLESAKTAEEKDYLKRSYEMLVDGDQMGARFKVLALFPKVLQPYLALRPPAGFVGL